MVEAATENLDFQAHIWNLAHANVHQAIRLTDDTADDKNQRFENLEKLPGLFKDVCVSFHGAFTDSLANGHMLKQLLKLLHAYDFQECMSLNLRTRHLGTHRQQTFLGAELSISRFQSIC
jgi:hypothetical protein